jgi:hypothetical protein
MGLNRETLINGLNRLLRRADAEIVRPSDFWRTMGFLGRQPQRDPARQCRTAEPWMQSFGAPADSLFDFAVVMPTVIRPSIAEAIASIFAQTFPGRVQTLIGIDAAHGDRRIIVDACRSIPCNHSVMVLSPGYSTSARHGGLHPAWDGGALRTILCYLAHSRRVTFLDDDNWWAPTHLQALETALAGHEWAWSSRWFVHPDSRSPICEDIWESVGPAGGIFEAFGGGWTDPNTIAFDKTICEAVLRWWSLPVRNSPKAMDADRNVFGILSREFLGRSTKQTTVYYTLNTNDPEHNERIARIGEARYAEAGKITDKTGFGAK